MPVIHDFNAISGWRELVEQNRWKISSAFWNPEKRYRKAITDCCQSILQNNSETLPLTIPYLLVSSVVLGKAATAGARGKNSAVISARRYATKSPDLFFFQRCTTFDQH